MRTALSGLSYGDLSVKAGQEFDDSNIPAEILEAWEKAGYCSVAPKKVVAKKKVEKTEEISNGNNW